MKNIKNFEEYKITETLEPDSYERIAKVLAYGKDADFYSSIPTKKLKTWDEIFKFQAKKDGANYTMLKDWLKKYYNEPTLKK